MATILTAVPGFLALKAQRSSVTFDTSASEIAYPPNADVARIKDILAKERVADSTFGISIQNVGTQPASTVGIKISVPGEIISSKSIPSLKENTPWVTIGMVFEPSNSPSVVSYDLKNLAVGPKFKVDVSYRRTGLGDPKCEIFSDGFPAVSTEDAANKTRNGHSLFLKPLAVFVLGTIITVVASVLYLIRRRPELKTSFEIVFGSLFPFASVFFMPARLARDWARNQDYREYRNKVFEALLNKDNVQFPFLTDGQLRTDKPEEFWDIQAEIKGIKVGVDVHTKSQEFLSGDNHCVEFCACLSHMTRIMGGKSFLVFDTAQENSDEWKRLVQIISKLNHANPSHEITLVFGNPSEAVEKIISAIALSNGDKKEIATIGH